MPLAIEVALPLAPHGPEVLALLWAMCGSDHGIQPTAPVELYCYGPDYLRDLVPI